MLAGCMQPIEADGAVDDPASPTTPDAGSATTVTDFDFAFGGGGGDLRTRWNVSLRSSTISTVMPFSADAGNPSASPSERR